MTLLAILALGSLFAPAALASLAITLAAIDETTCRRRTADPIRPEARP